MEVDVPDAYEFLPLDVGDEQNVHAKRSLLHFKDALQREMDGLPQRYDLTVAQRSDLVRHLPSFSRYVYLMNPAAVVAGYLCMVLARTDRNNPAGEPRRRHVKEVLEVFADRLERKGLNAYDVVRYAMAFATANAKRVVV